MSFRSMTMKAAVAASIVGGSIASSAAMAAPAPAERAGAAVAGSSELADRDGGFGGWFVPLLALLAIIAGIIAATSDGDDAPVSP